MDKYNWSFDGEAEIWYNAGASIEDCIAQARYENDEEHGGEYKTVFVGERVPFNIADNLNVEAMLESLQESAYEFCGDAADSWDTYNPRKPEEINELREAIALVVIVWLAKHGRSPRFCAIENVAEYDLFMDCDTCKHGTMPGKPCATEDYDCMACGDWEDCKCRYCHAGSKWEWRGANGGE
jgi:hypothetical protein